MISCESNNEWGAEIKKNFLEACVEEASIYATESSSYSYCDCCLVELQKTYDQESYMKEEAKLLMGLPTSSEFNDNMANTAVQCMRHLAYD